jgi:hypothetical protein
VRFTLDGAEVTNVTNEPRSLVELTRAGGKGPGSGGGNEVPGQIDAATGQVIEQ